MKVPTVPVDEEERLYQLRSLAVLDTPPEERFDRVTRMARHLFNVPIALISLVDENRQWFKSCVGLDVNETERRISFCAHAILNRGVLVIEDATQDDRFFDNPLVTGDPHIRFYAGQPLHTLSGQGIGTLCIIDRVPRSLGEEDLAMLSDLAGMVEREILAVQFAILDELTRISNRRGFLTLSKHTLDLCRRHLYPAALVYFDLDQFKQVNDSFGHAEGDRLLKVFAEQMRESFRASDLFARIGGDEFVTLLTNVRVDAIKEKIDHFDHALQLRCSTLELPCTLRFSYGVVAYEPLRHGSIEDMLHEADSAMYENKRARHLAAK